MRLCLSNWKQRVVNKPSIALVRTHSFRPQALSCKRESYLRACSLEPIKLETFLGIVETAFAKRLWEQTALILPFEHVYQNVLIFFHLTLQFSVRLLSLRVLATGILYAVSAG